MFNRNKVYNAKLAHIVFYKSLWAFLSLHITQNQTQRKHIKGHMKFWDKAIQVDHKTLLYKQDCLPTKAYTYNHSC